MPRSYLFVPGNRPERFDKAMAAGADTVILDLEDSVCAAEKESARHNILRWCAARRGSIAGLPVMIRTNSAGTPWFDDDLALVAQSCVRGAMLPKAEEPDEAERLAATLPPRGAIVALVETARGICNAQTLARSPAVERLAFGALDYSLDLSLSGDSRGLMVPATLLALASRCAGKPAPIAGVTPEFADPSRLEHDLAFERSLGFGAKLCIHPSQVATVCRAYSPSAQEVDWARQVIDAIETSGGVAKVNGAMADRPIELKAREILSRAS